MDTNFTAITIKVLTGETHRDAVWRTLKNERFPMWLPCVEQRDGIRDAPTVFLSIDEIPIIDVKYKMTGEWVIRFEQT